MASPPPTQSDLAEALLGLRIGDNNDVSEGVCDPTTIAQPTVDTSRRIIGANCDYHELHLEFPAMSLLPAVNKTPYLPEPANIYYRERPVEETLRLCAEDLSFHVRIETIATRENSSLPYLEAVLEHDAQALKESIERLGCTPGVSSLGFVAWLEDGIIQCRARLCARWIYTDKESVERTDLIFNYNDWLDLHGERGEFEWLDVVDDLLERSSDRAYFHVSANLRALDVDLARVNDQMLAQGWDSQSSELTVSNRTLVARMQWLEGNSQEATAILPCRHHLQVEPYYILNTLDERQAADFACLECGTYVLSDMDYEKVQLFRDKCWRLKHTLDERCWAALNAKLVGCSGSLAVSGAELFDAIESCGITLLVPESVYPIALCPGATFEIAALMSYFEQLLRGRNDKLTFEVGSAVEVLVGTSLQKLRLDSGIGQTDDIESLLPPGYSWFLKKWFTRVVAFLAARDERRENELVDELMTMMLSGS